METKPELEPKKYIGNVSVLRVSLTIIARSRLFIPTLYLFIVIIFFTVAFFCVRRKIFLQEFHMCVCVATWDHDCHEYSSSLCRLSFTMDETRSPLKKRYE